MKAAVVTKPYNLEIRDVPKPEINDDEVLVKVHYCGICGTDVHVFHGNYAADQLPLTPGHEYSGVIAEVGKNAKHLKEGTPVVVDMHIPCHKCFYCRKSEFLNCPEVQQIGITRPGGYAEYVKAPARNIMPISKNLSLLDAVMVEPIACVVRSTKKSNAGLGKSAVVIGCGSVGNIHLQMLKIAGVAPIFVLEPSELRANIARETGADFVCSNPDEIKDLILANTVGVDIAIESVGKKELYEKALELIRPGGHVVGFGLTGAGVNISLDIFQMVMQENSFKGTLAAAGQDMYDALTLVECGRFSMKHHTQNIIPLEDFKTELELAPADRKYLKTVVKLID